MFGSRRICIVIMILLHIDLPYSAVKVLQVAWIENRELMYAEIKEMCTPNIKTNYTVNNAKSKKVVNMTKAAVINPMAIHATNMNMNMQNTYTKYAVNT